MSVNVYNKTQEKLINVGGNGYDLSVYAKKSDITNMINSETVKNIVSCTKEQYDAMEEHPIDTLYSIIDDDADVNYFDTSNIVDDFDTFYIDEENKNKVLSEYGIRKIMTSNTANFYFDYQNGSNDNDGLTVDTPRKTISQAYIKSIRPNANRYALYIMSDYPEKVALTSVDASLTIMGYNKDSENPYAPASGERPKISALWDINACVRINAYYLHLVSNTADSGYTLKIGATTHCFLRYSDIESVYTGSSTKYAVSFERCGSIYINDCTFTGTQNTRSNCAISISSCGVVSLGSSVKFNNWYVGIRSGDGTPVSFASQSSFGNAFTNVMYPTSAAAILLIAGRQKGTNQSAWSTAKTSTGITPITYNNYTRVELLLEFIVDDKSIVKSLPYAVHPASSVTKTYCVSEGGVDLEFTLYNNGISCSAISEDNFVYTLTKAEKSGVSILDTVTTNLYTR